MRTSGRRRENSADTLYSTARGQGLHDADALVHRATPHWLTYSPQQKAAYLRGVADALRAYAEGYQEASDG